MVGPGFLVTAWRGLFPPPIGVENVHPAIAVDVTDANAVGGPISFLGNVVHDPLPRGIRRIGFGITDLTATHVDDLRLTVAIYVAHHGNFALHLWHHFEFLPKPVFPLGVQVGVAPTARPAIRDCHHVW